MLKIRDRRIEIPDRVASFIDVSLRDQAFVERRQELPQQHPNACASRTEDYSHELRAATPQNCGFPADDWGIANDPMSGWRKLARTQDFATQKPEMNGERQRRPGHDGREYQVNQPYPIREFPWFRQQPLAQGFLIPTEACKQQKSEKRGKDAYQHEPASRPRISFSQVWSHALKGF